MTDPGPTLDDPAFGWNAFGWFGGSLGGNAALIVGAIQFFPHSLLVGSVWLVAYLVVLATTIVLWQYRTKISAYVAIQVGLGIFASCWLVSVCMAIFLRPDLIPVVSSTPVTPFQKWLMNTITNTPALALVPLLIFPILMCWLHRKHRQKVWGRQLAGTELSDNN